MTNPYDRHWQRLRLKILERDRHRCYGDDGTCLRPATTVDHIVPVDEAPHLRLDPQNCRASCTKHNYGRANHRAAELIRVSRSLGTVRPW